MGVVDLQAASRSTPGEWIWCAALLLVPLVVVIAVFITGSATRRGVAALIERPASGLQAATGRPAWSSAGVEIGVWALIVAATGFFWDVAWHIDLGRDQELFTPPHTLIVAGLTGLLAAGITSTAIATVRRAEVGFRIGRVRVPWGAAGLIVLGGFASIGFPLDDLWHATYGIDVTMWSPTHLTMISGAGFAPIAVWLLYREGGVDNGRRWTRIAARPLLAGALVVALAAFQLEFDDGVPQWQMLYQPVLIALGATLALTTARMALGRGWALLTALLFLGIRGVLTLIVGVVLGHVITTIPLYLGIAVCVEIAFVIAQQQSRLVQALIAGALAGTVGLAVEWGWTHVWGYQPWQPSMLPAMWAAVLAAIAGAVLGTALGAVVRGGGPAMRGTAVALAGLAAVVTLAIPFARNNAPITATVTTTPVGAPQAATDRYGLPSSVQDVSVHVDVSPANAADNADVFRVIAWQGGGRVIAPLHQTRAGRWAAEEAVPTGASWKTIVMLVKGDVLAASPVSMPFDPQYAQAPIPRLGTRTAGMVPASSLLMREFQGGAGPIAIAAYALFILELVATFTVIALACVSLARASGGRSGGVQTRERPRITSQAAAMSTTTMTTT
ncbi:MAG: hypothetical protein ABR498_06960 [Candidatus Dormibacteria bacterium]